VYFVFRIVSGEKHVERSGVPVLCGYDELAETEHDSKNCIHWWCPWSFGN